jgi:two-component system, NtrC family, sensor kinase
MSDSADYGLFDREEQVLRDGLAALERLRFGDDEVEQAYRALLGAYQSGLREQRRLVRVSDRQQAQTAELNEALRESRDAAERALTELRATQESLIRAEKLAALGALVAGVAHEINTPIGTALASASFLARKTDSLAEALAAGTLKRSELAQHVAATGEAARLVLSNCTRAASLIRSFKQVAVDQTSGELRDFELRAYVEEVVVSLSPRYGAHGHVLTIESQGDIRMRSHPGALSQVLTNLVLNSVMHAYAPGVPGRLTLRLDQPAPGQVRLRYSDDGRGIPPEDLPQIFDPFFSTHAEGSGLGLHIVHNAVTGALRGTLAAESEPGRGAHFTITLPVRIDG